MFLIAEEFVESKDSITIDLDIESVSQQGESATSSQQGESDNEQGMESPSQEETVTVRNIQSTEPLILPVNVTGTKKTLLQDGSVRFDPDPNSSSVGSNSEEIRRILQNPKKPTDIIRRYTPPASPSPILTSTPTNRDDDSVALDAYLQQGHNLEGDSAVTFSELMASQDKTLTPAQLGAAIGKQHQSQLTPGQLTQEMKRLEEMADDDGESVEKTALKLR